MLREHHRRCAGIALLAGTVLAGCLPAEDDAAEPLEATGSALAASGRFNDPDDHFEQEVRLPAGTFGIYTREGDLLTTVDASQRTGWIQGHERVDSKVGALYWLWGFKSGLRVSGYVRGAVVAGERNVPAASERGAPNGNGRAAPLDGTVLTVKVRPLPSDFRHATTRDFRGGVPGDVNAVAQYAVSPVSERHAYLAWSVPWDPAAGRPLRGGGIVRSLVEDGTSFHRAAVEDIAMPAYSPGRKRIGTIVWSYGFVRQNGARVFGWAVRSHARTGEPSVLHLE